MKEKEEGVDTGSNDLAHLLIKTRRFVCTLQRFSKVTVEILNS